MQSNADQYGVELIKPNLEDAKSIASTTTSSSLQKRRRTKVASVLISGVGFLADAYDLFVVDFVLALISATGSTELTQFQKSLIVSTTHAGAVCGQLLFGIAADFIGRRTMFITTATLVIFGSILSALIGWGYKSNSATFGLVQQLALCRFFLGFGIGGEYPLSATVASENETEEELNSGANEVEETNWFFWYISHKPNSIAAVFSMQGLGMLLSPLFVMIFIKAGLSLELTWRICLAVGAIPSAIAFYFRWRMHETAAFKKAQIDYSFAESYTTKATDDPKSNVCIYKKPNPEFFNKKLDETFEQQILDQNIVADCANTSQFDKNNSSEILVTKSGKRRSWKSFGKHLRQTWRIMKEYKWILLGTSATWFIIDVTLYGTGSFKSTIIRTLSDAANPATTPTRQLSNFNINQINELQRPIVMQGNYFPATNRLLQVHRYLSGTDTANFIPQTNFSTDSISTVRRLIEDNSTLNALYHQAKMGAIIALIAIPGYLLSLFFIHRTGTRQLQLYGFIAVGIVFCALGLEQIFYGKQEVLEVVLFGLTFLFSNFGPNTTTFIIPTQLYPTIVRATCHGFSAAMGKLGGFLGTGLFPILEKGIGIEWLLFICGIVAFIGIPFTLLLPKDSVAKLQLIRKEMEFSELRKRRDLMFLNMTKIPTDEVTNNVSTIQPKYVVPVQEEKIVA